MEYTHAVLIGRFQPYHLAHQKLLELALARAEQVIVVLGGHRIARNIRNPWTSEEREQVITASLAPAALARVHVVAVRDFLYNHNLWLAELQSKVCAFTRDAQHVALVGYRHDASSDYLEAFPQWSFEALPRRVPLTAAAIRENYFHGQSDWRMHVPPSTRDFLDEFARQAPYASLVAEQQFVDQYRKDWASAPYPPTFVTVDAVVVKSGHVLVVRRRGFPGKGLYALPGGFVRQDETLERSVVRELREETGLVIIAPELRKYIQASQAFDHPQRSLRGRTLTHGFYFNLGGGGELPQIKGGDDADKAWWMALNDVFLHEDKFFEDHFSIITHFVNRF